MKLLFVHQNFPGQFKHLAPAMARAGHQVKAMAIGGPGLPEIEMLRYRPARGSTQGIHPFAADFETKMIRGEACARAAAQLKAAGFSPDVIFANPGWGESLFLKDVWPEAKMLLLLEFFYAARGLDYDFDPEFARHTLDADARLRAKNAHLLLALQGMDWGVCPTYFQRDTLPGEWHDRIKVIFDGIDTAQVRPDPGAVVRVNGLQLRSGAEIITFVNRNLEPMRGYHVFMRALPEILRRRPNAVALIVGGDEVSYGAAPPAGKTWKQIFLDEIKEQLDMRRVFFLGRIPYIDYLRVLQVSACHVYLTYPFVLGWSCIEAMSAGCLVVGSDTAPVREVIKHGRNGILAGFFDRQALEQAVTDALENPSRFANLRLAARQSAEQRYDLDAQCLPRQIALLNELASSWH